VRCIVVSRAEFFATEKPIWRWYRYNIW